MLASLPLALLKRVLEYAVAGFTEDMVPRGRQLPRYWLKELALVNSSWLCAIREIAVQLQRSVLTARFEAPSVDEVLHMQRQAEQRGTAVSDLRVKVGEGGMRSYESKKQTLLRVQAFEKLDVDWPAVFKQLPMLKRLDMLGMPLKSQHTREALAAAAKYCPRLEVLALPCKVGVNGVSSSDAVDALMKTLYDALKRWYASAGGLRQLTVPASSEADRFRSSTKFLEQVARFCPNIEYLDGVDKIINGSFTTRCGEQWVVSLKTWKAFNATCTKLRKFNWIVAPFGDPYFQVFGAYPKPYLTRLELSANSLWDWPEFFRKTGVNTSNNNREDWPGYGVLASEIDAMFQSCPRLTSLRISLDQRNTDTVDAEVFGDDFLRSLVRHCPLLDTLDLTDLAILSGLPVTPIMSFTDAGLLALADLKHFGEEVELCPSACTGNGIFEYLHRVSTTEESFGAQRNLGIRIGGRSSIKLDGRDFGGTGPPAFYTAIVELLERLCGISEEDLGAAACRRKTGLYIVNPYRMVVNEKWSASYLRELEPLLKTVGKMHPALNLSVQVMERTGGTFRRIDTVVLEWQAGKQERSVFEDQPEEGYWERDDEFEEYMELVPGLINLLGESGTFEQIYENAERELDESGDEDEDEDEDEYYSDDLSDATLQELMSHFVPVYDDPSGDEEGGENNESED